MNINVKKATNGYIITFDEIDYSGKEYKVNAVEINQDALSKRIGDLCVKEMTSHGFYNGDEININVNKV